MPAVKNNGLGRRLVFKLNSTMSCVTFSKSRLPLGLSFSNYQVRVVDQVIFKDLVSWCLLLTRISETKTDRNKEAFI